MEKIKTRDHFLKNFEKIFNDVKIDKNFEHKLKEYRFFKDHVTYIENLPDAAKKAYILLELTKTRKSCEIIIELLVKTHQKEEIIELMKGYNKSPGLLNIWNLSTDTNILVEKAKIPNFHIESGYYKMQRYPRGKCIIINNEPAVYRETHRFKHVFGQLYFDVQPFFNKNVIWIKEYLTNMSENSSLLNDNALVVVVITHGEDEKVLGYDACLESKKKEPNLQINKDDQMLIADVVNIFKDFIRIPIIFIFDCCRIKTKITEYDINKLIEEFEKRRQNEETDDQTENDTPSDYPNIQFKKVENMNNFVMYSCASGYRSWVIFGGLTAFGQGFTHAIARYACEESLQRILNRTCALMAEYKQIEVPLEASGLSAPEVRKQCAAKDLMFNVGFYDNSEEDD